MNDKELQEFMQNLDLDLIEKELDPLWDGMDIDMEAITQKARDKFQKEHTRMKKRRIYPFIAAALIAATSVTVVYASEISDFVKSFFNQKQIYSGVVEGDAFYLKSPIQLDEDNTLETVIFTKKKLEINFTNAMQGDVLSDLNLSITSNGTAYAVGGYGKDSDRYFCSFYNETDGSYTFSPANSITFTIGQKSYEIELSEGESVVAQGEILPAQQQQPEADIDTDIDIDADTQDGENSVEPIVIDWVNVGYQQTESSVQVLTSFTDKELLLVTIGEPAQTRVEKMDDYENGISNGTSSGANPLMGYDRDGNAYEFTWDETSMVRPVSLFESTAPAGLELNLVIPSLIVRYDFEKQFPTFNLDIPGLGETINLDREIDLGLQETILMSITRTSATTATLDFDLNTGDRKEVAIREAWITCENIKKVESLWEGNHCTITITFDENLQNTKFGLRAPSFVINGNWSLALQ